ncbi:MAG TPA: hypothetical protein DEP84_02800 [Chloroflexi bacterium]|nr:hypothetical protein [Chloroflexota bacterium]
MARWGLRLTPEAQGQVQKSYVDPDRTDLIDAFVVVDRLRFQRDLAAFWLDETYRPLWVLAIAIMSPHLGSEKACCLAILCLKFSEYNHPDKHQRPVATVFGAASPAVGKNSPPSRRSPPCPLMS